MRSFASRALAALLLLAPVTAARADTPVALRESFAGPLDVAGTAGTLRRFSNLLDACAVDDHGSAPLTGIPAGATVVSATLYWAGSWSTAPGSGQRVPDWDVSLDGLPLSAERRYTARYSTGGVDFDFFQGVADVTSHVAARGNGLYQFAGLSVNDGPPHCASQAVLAGWSLMVVYSAPGEPLRVVNRYDGLQALRGEQVTLQPNNFRIPQNGRDGRFAVLSWEGDEENSQNMGGVRETLSFNRRPLRDRINPVNNPYNSTANWINDPTTWGWTLTSSTWGPDSAVATNRRKRSTPPAAIWCCWGPSCSAWPTRPWPTSRPRSPPRAASPWAAKARSHSAWTTSAPARPTTPRSACCCPRA